MKYLVEFTNIPELIHSIIILSIPEYSPEKDDDTDDDPDYSYIGSDRTTDSYGSEYSTVTNIYITSHRHGSTSKIT